MKLYAIHAPLGIEAVASAEGARAARTGFSFAALLFGPLWLLARGLWLALILYAALAAAVVSASSAGWLSAAAATGLFLLGNIYLGFAGRGIAAAARERAGRPLVDVVFAGSALEAEKVYLERVLRPSPPLGSRRPPAPPPEIIGLFPEPGR
jgi:hypothetical protein